MNERCQDDQAGQQDVQKMVFAASRRNSGVLPNGNDFCQDKNRNKKCMRKQEYSRKNAGSDIGKQEQAAAKSECEKTQKQQRERKDYSKKQVSGQEQYEQKC